jgi:hypothetical protein
MGRDVALIIGMDLRQDGNDRFGRSEDVVVDVYQVCFLVSTGREV